MKPSSEGFKAMRIKTILLQKSMEYLVAYLESESRESDIVICAHQLRQAIREIGFITGKVSSDKILDVVFSDFCIGK